MQEHLPGDADRRTDEPVFLGFGSLYARRGDHIGHFYQTRDEWGDLVIPFIKTGLEAGDKCVYLMSPELRRQDLCAALTAAHVQVEEALASGQLLLEEERSTPQELQEWFTRVSAEVPARFRMLRWGGDMTWALQKDPTSRMLMEWETMCNVMDHPPAVFLCQYDLTQFYGHVIMEALKTHPLCIVGHVVHRNPYYLEPGVFLEELQHRRVAHKTS